MREEAKGARQKAIEDAAYAILQERGYEGTSMLAIARRARASNETLYAWYGNKPGLFRVLVERNAAEVKGLLEEGTTERRDPLATLELLGPRLLELLTGPRVIALNRAAAGDATGELGRAIAEAGRNTIAPLIGRLLDAARGRGQLSFADVAEAADVYLGLVIGDVQIRCIVHGMPQPPAADRERRAQRGLAHLVALFRPGGPAEAASDCGMSGDASR